MTNSNIVQQRLHNQHLSHTRFQDPAELVQWFGAMQAQDYTGAKWALGARLPGVTEDEVERAFTAGAILRTHVLRPTWHFVAPADIRWLLALTAPRVEALNAGMYRKCELDPPMLSRSLKVLTKALQGGRQLTREELGAALTQAGIVAGDTQRLAYLMMHAELAALICSGARRGKQFTYALLEERAPQTQLLEHKEALGTLVHRFFASRGPATLQDFAWWSGLTLTDAKRGAASAQARLEKTACAGQTYWTAPIEPWVGRPPQTAYLLPNYDEYGIGYRDRSAFFDAGHASQLVFNHLLLIKGSLAGAWKRTLKKQEVLLEINTFAPLTKALSRAVDEAARQYGAFLGLPVACTYRNPQ